MIKRDFHGWKYDDALNEVHKIVGEVRMEGKLEHAEFVTGHGVIQRDVLGTLEAYGLTASVNWSNTGVINVTIE